MDTALDSHFDLDSMYTYSPASKCSSALTRSLPLVSPFQGCLKAVSPAVPRPPVVPHQPSQIPRHDQYEISGLKTSFFYNTLNNIKFLLMTSQIKETLLMNKMIND
ncbi:MAG: hypothetical protein K9M81_05505 [Chthoniobacterales bacterium]|nr:hypothetical protein [Chthoniobacterales bacterium]